MSDDLSEGAKALVQAGRRADRPSQTDRERVALALRQRLGDATLLASSVAQARRATDGTRVLRSKVLTWGVVGSSVLVAGVAWLAARFEHDRGGSDARVSATASLAQTVASAVPSASAASSTELPASTPVPMPVPAPASAASAAASPLVAPRDGANRSAEPARAVTRSHDGLAEEVALLSRAETELHAGRPSQALVAIAEHQRKFPRGSLAEERTAAKIQALCALGRNEEANAQLRQLLHISPKSALEERSRQACR